MITTIFLNIITGIISFFVNLLPDGGAIPTSWISGVYTIWSNINAFSFIVPVDVLLYCLGIAMAFHLFQFGWNLFHWIFGMIRGSRMH